MSVFAAAVEAGVCRLRRPDARWLSTGFDGGTTGGPAAYNVTVPEGFDRTDLTAYAAERRAAAGFDDPGPTLFTGVAQRHARRARLDPVEAVATAGLSNPAALPVPARSSGGGAARCGDGGDGDARCGDGPRDWSEGSGESPPVGTVNLVVGTTRALPAGALASLLAVVAEAKAATLLARTGFSGTTSDAAVVACDPAGKRATFAGSATEVGRAARVCVRDALLASLDSRYADEPPPSTVDDAVYGVVADERAAVSRV